jgi:adenylate cyclase
MTTTEDPGPQTELRAADGRDADDSLPGMGSPTAWSSTDKCLLCWGLTVVIVAACGVLVEYQLRHPQIVPYFDLDFLESVGLPFIWSYVAVASILTVVALLLRRRWPEARWLVYVTTTGIALGSAFTPSWMFGQLTSPLSIGLVVTIAVLGFILFERVALVALVLCLTGLMAITIAEQIGLIDYAPIFRDSPVHGGHLSTAWILGWGGMSIALALSLLALAYSFIMRWHRQERALAETSQQLGRANDVISHYVASQLAAQIRAGNFDALEHQERRKLTLFFSDIEAFAATADVIEPEELATVLNEYLAEMTEIGNRHGATIDKFVGDAIMIFFGAPEATDDHDHALRAVRMALEMQRRMTALQAQWRRRGFERPFRIRIGINTGHASIGNFGSPDRMDYTAIGRQVNLAARLQARCEPGKVLISHSTWVLIQDEVSCTPMGEVQVKGFHQPIKVYEVEHLRT